MKIAASITELIGNTTLVKLDFSENETTFLGKCEFMHSSGPLQGRIGVNMIVQALESRGLLAALGKRSLNMEFYEFPAYNA